MPPLGCCVPSPMSSERYLKNLPGGITNGYTTIFQKDACLAAEKAIATSQKISGALIVACINATANMLPPGFKSTHYSKGNNFCLLKAT